MGKRSSKKKPDPEPVPEVATEQAPAEPVPESAPAEAAPAETPDGKNAAAVALGRLGGKKGGPARAAKLTKEQRSESARKAAKARWKKKA